MAVRVLSAPIRLNPARITNNIQKLIFVWSQEILKRFATEVVPEVRGRLPVRSGRLVRSVRVEIHPYKALVYAEFYHAFLSPTFEAELRRVWRLKRNRIVRQALAVATLKSPPFG